MWSGSNFVTVSMHEPYAKISKCWVQTKNSSTCSLLVLLFSFLLPSSSSFFSLLSSSFSLLSSTHPSLFLSFSLSPLFLSLYILNPSLWQMIFVNLKMMQLIMLIFTQISHTMNWFQLINSICYNSFTFFFLKEGSL